MLGAVLNTARVVAASHPVLFVFHVFVVDLFMFLGFSAGFYTYEGSDEPWVSNGRMTENTFHNNVVSSTEVGVDMGEGDDNVFTGEAMEVHCTFSGYIEVIGTFFWHLLLK